MEWICNKNDLIFPELQFNVTGAEIETNANGEFYLNLWIEVVKLVY